MQRGYGGVDEHERARFLNAALMWARTVTWQYGRVTDMQAEMTIEARSTRGMVAADDESRTIFNHLRADRHFLVVATLNLVKALDKIELTHALPTLSPKHVRHLRNCLEHWDDNAGSSFEWFKRSLPGVDPTSHSWGPGGTLIGGVDFHELVAEVTAFRYHLLKLEADGWSWRSGIEPEDEETPPGS